MSSSLSPPASTARARASSTTLRPPTLALSADASLGRRRSNSVLDQPDARRSSMILLVASRVLDWFHPGAFSGSPKDECVLPISASVTHTAFGDVQNEKRVFSASSSSRWSSNRVRILAVVSLFPISTALVLLALKTLPVSVSWPTTVTDVAQLGRELHGYSQSGSGPLLHVLAVLSATAVWKHAWSVPGSVIWNVLAGALFSPVLATVLLTLLTTLGSLAATLLARPLAPLLTTVFPKALDMTRAALQGRSPSAPQIAVHDADVSPPGTPSKAKFGPTSGEGRGRGRGSAWVRLSILRLISVVPWSGINVACGVCGVSLADCALGAFIGTLPWTAVTCQIGDILQTVASTPAPSTSPAGGAPAQSVSSLLLSPAILLKLVLLSSLSLAPILGRRRLQSAFLGPSSAEDSSPSSPSSSSASASASASSGETTCGGAGGPGGDAPTGGTWARIAERPWRERLRSLWKFAGVGVGVDEEVREEQRRWERALRERELAELVREKRAMQGRLLPS